MNTHSYKTVLVILATLLLTIGTKAQKRQKYEYMRNLPVYADSLIKDLTYPLAWGNSPITDFDEWRQSARQKVFDCMLTPPPAPSDKNRDTSVTLLHRDCLCADPGWQGAVPCHQRLARPRRPPLHWQGKDDPAAGLRGLHRHQGCRRLGRTTL